MSKAGELTNIITTLSKLCIDKNEGFLQLEFALQVRNFLLQVFSGKGI